jgi:hypothetical protein
MKSDHEERATKRCKDSVDVRNRLGVKVCAATLWSQAARLLTIENNKGRLGPDFISANARMPSQAPC